MVQRKKLKYKNIQFLLVLCSVCFLVLYFSFSAFVKTIKGEKYLSQKTKGKVAVVEVKGVITSSKEVIKNLHKALENDSYKAIILRIDSPGGAVAPTQEIYHEILEGRENKTIYASLGTIAASGGYYIASAAEKIFSSRGTLTGSIGVIMHFADLSKLIKMVKVDPKVLKAGKFKDTGNIYRKMKKSEENLLQEMLDDVHLQFKEDIQKNRKGILKKQISELGEGQLFTGQQAKKLGLVDEVGGLWVTHRSLIKKLSLDEKTKLKYIKSEEKFLFSSLLEDMYGLAKSSIGMNSLKSLPMFLYD